MKITFELAEGTTLTTTPDKLALKQAGGDVALVLGPIEVLRFTGMTVSPAPPVERPENHYR
jgi:hypothetical protein